LGTSAAQPSGTAAAPARALVGYARVSTRDQTTALQLDALRAAGCDRVFEETASGASRDRPELAAALDYVRAGDTLVVWKLDRLARSTKQLLTTVEELARRGIGFRCLTQDIDTTTAGGRLVFTVFSAIAEFEREIIAERTRAGLDAARTRGRRGGRKPKLKARDLVRAGHTSRSGDPGRGGRRDNGCGRGHPLPPPARRPRSGRAGAQRAGTNRQRGRGPAGLVRTHRRPIERMASRSIHFAFRCPRSLSGALHKEAASRMLSNARWT